MNNEENIKPVYDIRNETKKLELENNAKIEAIKKLIYLKIKQL